MIPRVGFAIEQALGHVAYGLGLRHVLQARDDLELVWMAIPFEAGAFGRVPLLGNNWTVRGSWRARQRIGAARREGELGALFVHTQTIGLFSGTHMDQVPTLLSLDATPRNYDELAHTYGDRSHPPAIEKAKLLAHRAVMAKASWITAWSEWTKASLVRDYAVDASRVTVLAPGTVLSNFPSAGTRTRRQGRLRVLFVGGDFLRKGGDVLLEVCRRPTLRDQVELHLVTGAEVAPAANVFVYRGLKPHSPELLKRYAEADVFALPTRGDCLAVVLGEAMAASLPIITTHVGAQPEAVEEGKSGFVIQPDDADALEDRLLRLVRDPELAERMGQSSRAVGEERFDMQKNATRIAELLLRLAAERSRRAGA